MPEKSLNEVAQGDRELFEKGMAAVQRNNLDYALAIFTQVLKNVPSLYECREALRSAQMRKAGSGGGFFKRMMGTAGASPLLAKAQFLLRSDPAEALNICEQILNSDPNNVSAHKILAEGALMLDFPKTAVLSLGIAQKNSPGDQDLAVRLAEALLLIGNNQAAETIYKELQKRNPTDSTLAQALKNIAARRTMLEGGYEGLEKGEGSYRDILKNKAEAVSLEQEKREVKDEDVAGRLIAEYEARLAGEPDNLRLIRSIAELYTQRNEFDKALAYYAKITDREGVSDMSLEKAITETKRKEIDYKISKLDKKAPDYAQQVEKLRTERDNFQIDDCKRRVDKYPNDLQLRFELGMLLFQAGRISEAMPEFQKAQQHPNRRIQAMNMLGICFAQRNMNDLAARTFQNALKEKIVFDDEKKAILYNLGEVLEKMGKKEEAIEQFKQVYEVDIGYRDVAAKVDAYYAG
ncbi:MAG: tetratricopeptide repeat protein [Verrucomicrobiota bacterium]|nr:tetratricopeptide repeat protein [Verrucomicrobiota bacterium]